MGDQRLVLLLPLSRPVDDGGQHLDEQLTPERGELGGELVGRLAGDRAGRLRAEGTRVDALADPHDRDTGLFIASQDRTLDRRRPAPARQQRCMHVHAAGWRHSEHLIGQDTAIGGDAEHVGLGGAQGAERLLGHAGGLEHGETELERTHLDRRGLELLPARAHGIGARHDERDLEGICKSPERGNGELRRPHEYHLHGWSPSIQRVRSPRRTVRISAAYQRLHQAEAEQAIRSRLAVRRAQAPPGSHGAPACADAARVARTS